MNRCLRGSFPLSSGLVLVLALGVITAVATALGAPPAAARHVAADRPTGRTSGATPAPDEMLRSVPPTRPAPAAGVWPLRPRPAVVARFDPPRVQWGPGHRGADLAGHPGQRVRTALPGRVTFVGRVAGRGVVVVGHGARRTTYEPVLGTVPRGARVEAGDVIGRLAAVGSHCAPATCLHWGLRRGDTYLDPLTLVDAPRPVRLLPW
jgi:murein DD-endopeptidase MepM/ murein hydrolase activator NlpD